MLASGLMVSDTEKDGCFGRTVQLTKDSGDMDIQQITVSLLTQTETCIKERGLRIKCTDLVLLSTNQEQFT